MSSKTDYRVTGKMEYYPKMYSLPKVIEVNKIVKAYSDKEALQNVTDELNNSQYNNGISMISELKLKAYKVSETGQALGIFLLVLLVGLFVICGLSLISQDNTMLNLYNWLGNVFTQIG